MFVIAAFALVPAICEELAFRGFILSGLGRTGRSGVAIVLSSVTFGIIHMLPQQVFNATLVGMLIGLIAVRSNSLFPGILFHFCFNALAVLHGQASEHFSKIDAQGVGLIYSMQDQTLQYGLGTLAICAAIAMSLIAWLIREGGTGNPGTP